MSMRGRLLSVGGKLDTTIDDTLNRYFEPPAKREYGLRSRFSRYSRTAGASIKGLDGFGESYLERLIGMTGGGVRWSRWLTSSPLALVLVVTFVTCILGSQAPQMIQAMRGDIEIYLPPNDPSTTDLQEVRSDFSTDAMIVYVELPPDSKRNITDYEVLVEMSHVEGDDTYNNHEDVLDWNRDGTGEGDGVIAILSLATIIKALYQTANSIANSTVPGGVPQTPYEVPNDQATIDKLVEQIAQGGALSSLARDDNGDGILDTAIIMVMLSAKYVGPKEVPKMVEKVDHVIKRNARLTKMTNTGPTTMINNMQKRTVSEFSKAVPLVVIALMCTLFFFHRTWKVWFVALMPVSYALVMTFGLVGIFHEYLVITPQVVLAAPVLLSLGVSYGLYISNRFVEEKKGSSRERVEAAIGSQFWAIALSAATTAIGFASLMIGTLPPIAALGFVLTVGILLTFALTVIMVPSIVLLVGYQKKAKFANWESFAETPLSHRKKIMLAALAVTMLSVVFCMPLVKFNADYLAMAPQDEPSVIKMAEYSKKFGGGQLGMIIIRTEDLKDPNSGATTLRIMNQTETYMQEVPNTKGISIVDIMKSVSIKGEYLESAPFSSEVAEMMKHRLIGKSFYDAMQSSIPNSAKAWLINVLFNSMPIEFANLLVKPDYSKALIYVLMPMMDIEKTRAAVKEVNSIVDSFGKGIPGGSMSHITGTATLQISVNDLMVQGQLTSLAVCLFLSWLALLAVFRSPKLAAVTLIPVSVVISWEPLTLYGLNIALSLITVMIGSIAIGTGVDFSIQITQRFRRGGENLTALKDAVANCGISFVEATCTMVFGFLMLLFVPIASIRDFVVMFVLLLVFSACVAMLVLPSVYTGMYNLGLLAKKRKVLYEDDEWVAEWFAMIDTRLEELERDAELEDKQSAELSA